MRLELEANRAGKEPDLSDYLLKGKELEKQIDALTSVRCPENFLKILSENIGLF
jgi:hypothetical protein